MLTRLLPALLLLAALGPPAAAQPAVETVATGLEHPWSLAFLADGSLLVTERPGRLRHVDASGRLSSPLAGLPAARARGQGGLLDVVVDPAADDGLGPDLMFAAAPGVAAELSALAAAVGAADV